MFVGINELVGDDCDEAELIVKKRNKKISFSKKKKK